jgi:hypothetical protein
MVALPPQSRRPFPHGAPASSCDQPEAWRGSAGGADGGGSTGHTDDCKGDIYIWLDSAAREEYEEALLIPDLPEAIPFRKLLS